MTAKTPLHAAHISAGGQLVNFHGWEMPLHYGSQLHEHHLVRNDAGLFDVSHLGKASVKGHGALEFLNKMFTNDLHRIIDGKAQYTLLCNDDFLMVTASIPCTWGSISMVT